MLSSLVVRSFSRYNSSKIFSSVFETKNISKNRIDFGNLTDQKKKILEISSIYDGKLPIKLANRIASQSLVRLSVHNKINAIEKHDKYYSPTVLLSISTIISIYEVGVPALLLPTMYLVYKLLLAYNNDIKLKDYYFSSDAISELYSSLYQNIEEVDVNILTSNLLENFFQDSYQDNIHLPKLHCEFKVFVRGNIGVKDLYAILVSSWWELNAQANLLFSSDNVSQEELENLYNCFNAVYRDTDVSAVIEKMFNPFIYVGDTGCTVRADDFIRYDENNFMRLHEYFYNNYVALAERLGLECPIELVDELSKIENDF